MTADADRVEQLEEESAQAGSRRGLELFLPALVR
jgi:hypothetical protein